MKQHNHQERQKFLRKKIDTPYNPKNNNKINYLIVIRSCRLLIFTEIENAKVKFKGKINFQMLECEFNELAIPPSKLQESKIYANLFFVENFFILFVASSSTFF